MTLQVRLTDQMLTSGSARHRAHKTSKLYAVSSNTSNVRPGKTNAADKISGAIHFLGYLFLGYLPSISTLEKTLRR